MPEGVDKQWKKKKDTIYISAERHPWNAIAEPRERSPSLNRILDQHSPDTCRSLGIKEEEEEDLARLPRQTRGREGRETEGMIGGQGRGFPGARLAPVYTTNGMDDSSPWLNLFLIQWLPSWLARLASLTRQFCPANRGARGLPSHRFEWNFKHCQIPSSWIFTILGSGGEYSWRYPRRRSITRPCSNIRATSHGFSRDLGSLGIKRIEILYSWMINFYRIRDRVLRSCVSKEIFRKESSFLVNFERLIEIIYR